MIRIKADASLGIFRDGKLAGSDRGFLDVAVSDAPRIMRICACSSTYGIAAEIPWAEISRVRSEIRAGALFVRATGEVTQLSDRVVDRGEVTAQLIEELSRDVVHLEVSRRGVLLAEIKITRAALDGLIALLAELDVASAVCHASAQNAPVLLPPVMIKLMQNIRRLICRVQSWKFNTWILFWTAGCLLLLLVGIGSLWCREVQRDQGCADAGGALVQAQPCRVVTIPMVVSCGKDCMTVVSIDSTQCDEICVRPDGSIVNAPDN